MLAATAVTGEVLDGQSVHVAPSAVVLPSHHTEGSSSRFEDDTWDLKAAIGRPNIKKSLTMLRFEHISGKWRLLAKEYMYARLHEYDSRPASIKASSCAGAFYDLRKFLRFLDERELTLPEVDQDDLDQYLRVLQHAGLQPSSTERYVSAVQHLYRLRNRISGDGLQILPWEMRKAHHVAGVVPSYDNKTPRIPEVVLGPVLRLATFYVETAYRDILAVRREIEKITTGPRVLPSEASSELRRWIRRRQKEGRGLPAHSPRFAQRHNGGVPGANYKQCLLMAGIASSKPTPNMASILQEAEQTMSLEPGGLDTEISLDPQTQLPWRNRFDRDSAAFETRMLMSACYIVIAYLSGMRDSEVQALRRGCREYERAEDGSVIRYRLKGTVWKNQAPTGKTAKWVVLPIVADAVGILEQLSSGELLFERPDHKRKSDVFGPVISNVLNQFLGHVGVIRPMDNVSMPNGSTWRLTTPQFRRTVAWHIANQPFGDIAGMIQYQHVRVTTFQGYAGTSESQFRLEVEREEDARKERDMMDMYEDFLEGATPTSQGGERLHRQFADVRESAGDFPGRMVNEQRRRTMLKAISAQYYAGVFNDCLLEEESALCLKGTKKPTSTQRKLLPVLPVRGLCSPAMCSNSNISERHRPAWEGRRAGIEERLATETPGELRAATLEVQLNETLSVLERFES